jgi:hypothetical protein
MASVTFAIPDKVKSDMKELSWVNWSEVGREEMIKQEERRKLFEEFKKIVSKSKFTERDAERLSEKVKKSMHDNLVKKGLI